MIRHAWSVVCAKSSIDRDTNNVTLDVLENITIGFQALEQAQMSEEKLALPHVLPVNLEVVSLWFSTTPGERQGGRARVELVSPKHNVVGRIDLPLDFGVHNLRTRARISGFGSEGRGTYLFRVSLDDGATGDWQEVATVPLEVDYNLASTTEPAE